MNDGQLAAGARALADPVRVQMVGLLARQGMCVAELQEQLGLGQSRASYHLAELRQAGLVRVQMRGRQRFYVLQSEALEALAAALVELARPGAAVPPEGRVASGRRPAAGQASAPRRPPPEQPAWLL